MHPTPATAEILTIGDELLRGDLIDTNATWLAAELEASGLRVTRITSVGDSVADIAGAFREAAARAPLVVASGGLGPTEDDLTVEALARAAGRELVEDPALVADLRARFAAAGLPFTENNARQARIPRGGEAIPNATGTAPGVALAVGAAEVFCLPGVPRELRAMFAAEVAPRIRARFGLAPALRRTLKVFGLTEARVDDRLAGLLPRGDAAPPGVALSLHYRATFPEIHVTLVARPTSPAAEGAAREALAALGDEARRRLGHHVFAEGEVTFAEAVVGLLRERGLKVALAESCTGGLAGDLLTRAPGASDVFDLGVVTYANRFKARLLGVSEATLAREGAVSRACVEEMARGVRALAEADVAAAISGIAGPSGGTPDKPTGTVHFAVATAEGVTHLVRRFPFDRQRVKLIAAYVALTLVRRAADPRLAGTDPEALVRGRRPRSAAT